MHLLSTVPTLPRLISTMLAPMITRQRYLRFQWCNRGHAFVHKWRPIKMILNAFCLLVNVRTEYYNNYIWLELLHMETIIKSLNNQDPKDICRKRSALCSGLINYSQFGWFVQEQKSKGENGDYSWKKTCQQLRWGFSSSTKKKSEKSIKCQHKSCTEVS